MPASYGSIPTPSQLTHRGNQRIGGKRWLAASLSLLLMLVVTALVALITQQLVGQGGSLLQMQTARLAARGRTKQRQVAKASHLGSNVPERMMQLGVAGAAVEIGSWMKKAFPFEFLSATKHSEAEESGEGCSCDVNHCFICLKEDALFEAHRHDAGEHSGVDNGHEDHGNVTAAHDTGAHDAAHKSFDKQMLRFAISGLSDGHGEESHSVHDDHGEGNEHGHEGGHEEYHPIEFFHYVPKCCEHPMMDKIESPDTTFNEPCYWDETELDAKDWAAYGHPVVCTEGDFKEAHTLVNTLSTWVVALICLVWMIGLVLCHNGIHSLLHGHHDHGHGHDDHDDGHGHGEEMAGDHEHGKGH